LGERKVDYYLGDSASQMDLKKEEREISVLSEMTIRTYGAIKCLITFDEDPNKEQ
jgi:hypothetical protein